MKKYEQLEMQFQTAYNRQPTVGEVNKEPSMTVPDQTMSLREIVRRYAAGLPINGVKIPLYDENPEDDVLPDPRTLDLAEREEMALQYAEELALLKEKYQLQTKAGKEPENGSQTPPGDGVEK